MGLSAAMTMLARSTKESVSGSVMNEMTNESFAEIGCRHPNMTARLPEMLLPDILIEGNAGMSQKGHQ